MMSLVVSLRGNERGAAIIELALVAPFFAALAIGMIDMSRAYSMKLKLEQAAQRGIEKVEQQHSVLSDYSAYATEASTAATAAGYSGSTASADYWLECNGVRQSDPTTPCTSGQTYARYVSITVSNTYTPLFPSRAWRARYATLCLNPTSVGCTTPTDTQITTKVTGALFGPASGITPTITTDAPNNAKTITLTYSQQMNFLFFTGPTVTFTRSKVVYYAH